MENGKKLKVAIFATEMKISVGSDGNYDDYISLPDIATYKSEESVSIIRN